jgi:uncharacterized membrane protein
MSTQPNWDDHLRMSDAEREQAATALGEHYAQGRLTTEEHSERLDRIWAAKTRAEVAPIFSDLPGPAAAPPPRVTAPHTSPRGRRRGFPLPLVVVFAILVVVTVLTNLPLILIGLAVWFLLMRRGSHARRSHRFHQARY